MIDDSVQVWRMSGLTRDGTAELDSRDQILRRERGQENNNLLCSADREQDWPPWLVHSLLKELKKYQIGTSVFMNVYEEEKGSGGGGGKQLPESQSWRRRFGACFMLTMPGSSRNHPSS